MHYYEVAPNQIIRPASGTFTYSYESVLAVGQLVTVEVGKKTLIGVVIREVKKPAYDTKPIKSLVEANPLPAPLIKTALWMQDYYATHLATVFQTILPRGLTTKRRNRAKSTPVSARNRTNNVFTKTQVNAIEKISAMKSGSALLHGVTGSGKTAVYIELAKRTLADGKSAIVLVPEIALTSQLVNEFSHHFDDIILAHSKQTEAERHTAWKDALNATTPRIVIGPRSALFLPLKNIGLIVIDEAHEPSFKQEQSPRYSALRAASILARAHGGKLVMGSATPLIADYYVALHSDSPIITMPERAQKDSVKPNVNLVDMTKRQNFKQHRFLSDTLLANISETITSGNQALIFHNRRGSATTTLCENCGWSAACPRCFIPLTLHADQHTLRCHVCAYSEKVPTSCPVCHEADIIHKGIGTKLIESELRKIFPKLVIARFDGDTHDSESVDKRYKELYDGDIQIIIGTQVVAKGLDLPKLRTVGVIQADAGLSLPDFSSSERTFQLLAQVVGRVGRSHHETNVIIQSYQPGHPSVVDGIAQNYEHFYTATIGLRKSGKFPPFTYLLKLTCVYKTEAAAIKNSRELADTIRKSAPATVEVLGPTPAFYERQHDTYRWQLTIKSPIRADLVKIMSSTPTANWQAELDPISLL